MIYNFKCTNKNCKEKGIFKTITKPMVKAGDTEYCKKCKKEMQRVYGLAGIRTAGEDKNK